MEKGTITILSVSFNSSSHLKRLFENLSTKTAHLNNLKFLIVDNTNGQDKNLYSTFDKTNNLKILKNDNHSKQRSISHASALDLGMKNIDTKYTLIVDPDIHIFQEKWDQICIKEIELNKKTVIGAPYPQWKLGKIHNYPSVVFMFFQTNLVQNFGKTFYPFPIFYKRILNSILRKIVRLGGLANKKKLGQFRKLMLICEKLENITGVTSPDTGNKIIKQFRNNGFKSIVFLSPYEYSFKKNDERELKCLAKDFEIFLHDGKPFMSHMYSSGVYHWRTKKSGDLQYWLSLIDNIEKKIEKV